jgi:hypothetical protein
MAVMQTVSINKEPSVVSFMLLVMTVNCRSEAVPWLRRLVAGLPPRRPGFDPGSVHVRFVVSKVALWFFLVNFIPPVLNYLKK